MKAEDLDSMLSKLSASDCVKFFSGATEADRKTVSGRALQWYEIADAFRVAGSPVVRTMLQWSSDLPKRTQKALDLVKQVDAGTITIPKEVRNKESLPVARLAVLASAGLSDVRKVGLPDPAYAFAIMRERRPRWLDRWMEFAALCDPVEAWKLVRQLETDGIAVAERGPGYWQGMTVTLGQMEAAELTALLLADQELLENHIWMMLDSTGAVRVLSDPTSANRDLRSPRNVDEIFDWKKEVAKAEQWGRASYIWRLVLSEMATARQISRTRLLDVIFEWIARLSTDGESKASVGVGPRTTPVGWFQSLHDEMGPDHDEKIALADRYVGLLSSKDASTLLWCLNNLSACPRETLPASDLLANFSNVFSHRRKEPAAAALKFLEEFSKDNSYELNQLGLIALEAFEHRSADVHKRALAFLKRSKAIESPEIAAGLKERLDRIGGLVRKDAAELVSDGSECGAQDPSDDTLGEQQELLSQARQITGPLAELAGIREALEACEGESDLPSCLRLDSLAIPRLNQDQRIVPLDNLDDLIYLLLHVLEDAASPDDFERALDGLLRLCHLRPDDFESRVSSLRKKVSERLVGTDQSFGLKPFTGANAMLDLAGIVRAWMDGKTGQSGLVKPFLEAIGISAISPFAAYGPMLFISERTVSTSRLVAKRIPLPLLSAPTHKGGWIDPVVLPERMREWHRAGVKLDKADFIQALLRIAPENRAVALALVPAGDNEYLNALRWALGGEMSGAVSTAELWVAAYRCRDPRGTSDLLSARFKELGPDAAVRARYDEKLQEYAKRGGGIFGTTFDHTSAGLPVLSSPPVNKRPALKYCPTELLHSHLVSWDTSNLFELIWPLDRESYFYHHARRVAAYLDSQGTYWQGSWDCLFDPDVPTRGMGAWLIALALSAKQPEAARLALDALIASIEDDRLDGTTFGAIMGKLLPTGRITLSRWITALKSVARISPAHQNFVIRAVELCLSMSPREPGKTVPIPMLELLYECLSTSGEHMVLENTRELLKTIEGKGKGAKLAKLMLELPTDKYATHRRKVALQMLQGRLQRIQRWQSYERAIDPQAAQTGVLVS